MVHHLKLKMSQQTMPTRLKVNEITPAMMTCSMANSNQSAMQSNQSLAKVIKPTITTIATTTKSRLMMNGGGGVIFLLSLLHWAPLVDILHVGPSEALIQVPNRHTVASIPGDLVLGILVPVHERPSPKQAQTRTCGAVREQYGIQRVEAAFRTIDSINADSNILPNITLGIEIRDSCWHSPIALEQSIEFIRDAMAASEQTPPTGNVNLLNNQQQSFNRQTTTQTLSSFVEQQINSNTNTNNSACAPLLRQQQLQLMQTKKVKNLVGVVGPASSTDTVQVQNLLQLFNMPQVGYSATSRDLSNKNFFKYFLRVVPSDKLQAQVLIDLMLAHNWTYITVAYTEGSYGSSLMNEFRERAQEAGICFATLESMPPNADDAKFDELIEAIQKHPNARVVICMCEGRTVGRLFAGFKRKNINNEYLVVGRFDVVEQQEEFALGGISIRIHSAYVHDFDDYYFSLNPFTNQRNPWFAEFWETRFQCNLEMPPTSSSSPSSAGSSSLGSQTNRPAFIRPPGAKVYNRTCTGKESLRQNHKQDAKMAFVQKSIITMALALDSMQRAICPPGRLGLCPEMLPVNGSILLQHLMNVSFSFLDEEVYFDEQGDPPGKYEILNFRRRRNRSSSSFSSQNPSNNDDDFSTSSLDSTSLPPSLPDVDDEANESIESGESQPTPNGNQDFSVVSSAANVNKAKNNNNNNNRIKRPYADSYSTLKVFRPPRQRPGDNEQVSPGIPFTSKRRRRRRQPHQKSQPAHGRQQLQRPPDVTSSMNAGLIINNRNRKRVEQQQQHLQESYSSTSDFEYVHVGSWKSSDGLSLFGDIQWPLKSQANADTPHWSVANDSSESSYHFTPSPTGDGSSSSSSSSSSSPSSSSSNYPLEPPKSVCSLPCAKGHAKKIQSDSVKCCWVCVACRPREYLFNEFKCKACEKGWWPNLDQTGCNQIPIQYLDWRSMEALTAISIACFGLILTLATGFVFIKHNDTPVVKSSTRELSYMILFAMILCYVNTFFLIAKPRKETCFVTRILPGFSFAMMYGALVTKTNRIARILAGSKKKIITRRPYFMSATAQVTITWLIVLIECAIIVSVLIKEPPDMMHDYPSDDRVVLVCNTTTTGIIAPLGFDFFLIAMCTLYAFKTRNVPENFNEAKFIGFTMYTTLVIWVAFVAIYLSSDHKVTTLCLCISFSALFALFLLFFPRCYIILFKPEKNNRSFFTTTKNVRCHIGYQITALAAGGATGAPQPTTTGTGTTSNLSHWSNWLSGSSQAQQPIAAISSRQQHQVNNNNNCPYSLPDWPATANTTTTGGQSAGGSGLKQQLCDQQLDEQQWQAMLLLAGPKSEGHNSRSLTSAHRVAPTMANLGSSGELQNGLFASQEATESAPKTPDGLNNPASGGGGHQQEEHRSSGGSLRHFFGSIRSAFARRSRRKESDKQSSIQQHLRAIRHAENLDRQTHFRRSQVQRLAQRFESNLKSQGSLTSHHYHHYLSPSSSFKQQQQQQLVDPAMIFQFNGPEQPLMSLDAKFELLTRGYEAQRLLATLNQLIGIENMWRLAGVLNGICTETSNEEDNNSNNDNYIESNNANQSDRVPDKTTTTSSIRRQMQRQHFPLDLRRLADRHLALAWLRFLVQMAHKAIESLQLNFNHQLSDHHGQANSASRLAALDNRRRRATLDQLDTTGLAPLAAPLPPLGLPSPADVSAISARALLIGQEANGDLSNNQCAPSSLAGRDPQTASGRVGAALDEQQQQQRDETNQERQLEAANGYFSAPLASLNSLPCDKLSARQKSPHSNELDPIKRALDCITGKQWAPAGARQQTVRGGPASSTSQSDQRRRLPDRGGGGGGSNNNNNKTRKQHHLIESKEKNSNSPGDPMTARLPYTCVTSQEGANSDNDDVHHHHHHRYNINSTSAEQQQQWPPTTTMTTANTSPEPFKPTMMTSDKRNYNINNNRPAPPATLQSCDKISSSGLPAIAGALASSSESHHGQWERRGGRGSQRRTQHEARCGQCCCPNPVACCKQTQLADEEEEADQSQSKCPMLSSRSVDLEDRDRQPEGGRGGNATGANGGRNGQQQEIMLPIVGGRGTGNNELGGETQITWMNSEAEYSRLEQSGRGEDSYEGEQQQQQSRTSLPNNMATNYHDGAHCSVMGANDSNQLDRCMSGPNKVVVRGSPLVTACTPDTHANNRLDLELHNLSSRSIDAQLQQRPTNNKSSLSDGGAGQLEDRCQVIEDGGQLPFELQDSPTAALLASTSNQPDNGAEPRRGSSRRCRRSRRLECCRKRARRQPGPQVAADQQLAPDDQGRQSACSGSPSDCRPCRLIKSKTDECVCCSSSSCCSSLTRRDNNNNNNGKENHHHGAAHNHRQQHQHHNHHRHHHRHHRQRPSRSVPPSRRTNDNTDDHQEGGTQQEQSTTANPCPPWTMTTSIETKGELVGGGHPRK